MPIAAAALVESSKTLALEVDAYLKRFEQLQDVLSNRLGRAVLAKIGDDVSVYAARAAFDRLESIGGLRSADAFFEITKLRHRLAHDYPASPDDQAATLNRAWAVTPALLEAYDSLSALADRLSAEDRP